MVFTIKAEEVVEVFSLEVREMGMGYSKLSKQDYTFSLDHTVFYIKITKPFKDGVDYQLKIKLLPNPKKSPLLPDEWLVPFTPKGSITIFFFFLLKHF